MNDDNSKCAVNSAYLAMSYHGVRVKYADVAKVIPNGLGAESTMADIARCLTAHGVASKGVECSLDDLKHHKGCFILYLEASIKRNGKIERIGHFVFGLYNKEKGSFVIADPDASFHLIQWSEKECSSHWTRRALLIGNVE